MFKGDPNISAADDFENILPNKLKLFTNESIIIEYGVEIIVSKGEIMSNFCFFLQCF